MSGDYSLAYKLKQEVLIWLDPTSVNQDYFYEQLRAARARLGHIDNKLYMASLESEICRDLGNFKWVELLGQETRHLKAKREKRLKRVTRLEKIAKDLPSE